MRYRFVVIALALVWPLSVDAEVKQQRTGEQPLEQVDDAPLERGRSVVEDKAAFEVVVGPYTSIQVNVSEEGYNISRDAANEPSLAVDPTAPNRIAIGWRQFDSFDSNFRTAGWGYSRDGGRSWVFPGVLEEGVFRSDPVLAADRSGRFYYYSLKGNLLCDLYLSDDGGASWHGKTAAFGGDKAWIAIDTTGGEGDGNIYVSWSTASNPWGERVFTRSTDGGQSFMDPIVLSPAPIWGTMHVGAEGELYIAGNAAFDTTAYVVYRSLDAARSDLVPSFDMWTVDLGGEQGVGDGPNPEGLLGQVWLDSDHSEGPTRGNLYMVSSVKPSGSTDPMDVHFIRSEDGGASWSEPMRVNTDGRSAWQWFGTMSVAPDGRIDVVWVESVNSSNLNLGELTYASSSDAGYSWSTPEPVSPPFDSFVGWPNQNKLGDYYHMVSDRVGAHLAYAATFKNEQDVYYLRIGDYDCNDNGLGDSEELASGVVRDCNLNEIPDSCEIAAGVAADENGDGRIDNCLPPPRRGLGRRGY